MKALAEPATLANLAGQMHVRLVEMHKRTHLVAASRVVKLEDPAQAFLHMPFDEAVRFWRERGGDPELLDEVLAAYREQAAANGDLMLDTISQRAIDAISRTLDEGGTLQDFKDAVLAGGTDEIASPLSDDYLDLVFRTQVQGAYGAGRHAQLTDPDVMAARPYRQGRTSEDERVRAEHRPIDGVVWRADDATFANVFAPFGFRCFPGDVEVQGTFDMGYRALYDGELVELTTKAGHRLSVTPNHPVATPDGFTAAGSLRQGDQVLGYHGPVNSDPVTGPRAVKHDHEHGPSRIDQIFGTIAEAGITSAQRHRSVDFDGDARFFQGHVDVVATCRRLGRDSEPQASGNSDDLRFASADALRSSAESSQGTRGDLGRALRSTGGSFPRSTALPFDGGPIHAAPLQEFGFGPAARLHASRYEYTADSGTIDAVFLRDLLLRSAGEIERDEIIGIRRYPFRGHVYDLQSPYGWIVAQGIVTSNCRCGVVSGDEEDLASWGGTVATSVPASFVITPGFGAEAF